MPPEGRAVLGCELAAALLTEGVRVRLRVSGQSMLPTLATGDTVELAPIGARRPRRGEILFLECPQRGWLLHRLVRTRRRDGGLRLQTRGDGHWRLDADVSAERVHGRVVGVRRAGARRMRRPPPALLERARALALLACSALRYVLTRRGGTAP